MSFNAQEDLAQRLGISNEELAQWLNVLISQPDWLNNLITIMRRAALVQESGQSIQENIIRRQNQFYEQGLRNFQATIQEPRNNTQEISPNEAVSETSGEAGDAGGPVWRLAEAEADDRDRECGICLDEIISGNLCFRGCHSFHRVCLWKWLVESQKNTCPYCRRYINRSSRELLFNSC